ncbi:hypothetical protein BDN72DRAFT_550443 [Pluteus cervinus]|uniref:Uncharacterized protein n=1 Tax=Pluteus cervinus TaxID=181527 RepID=A0ACD3AWR9_9AGAR|nr:hypothetical protein BDN72DRAFT_550443 [Pluteus cervinus]
MSASGTLSTEITLFDIPTIHPKPNSPNTWKVRLVLNYKNLNYTTRWVPSSEIQPTCKALGIPPTGIKFGTKDEPHYTLPAIIDYTRSKTNPVILSDSTPIIEYLEKEYPSKEENFDSATSGLQDPIPLFPRGTRAFHALMENFIANHILLSNIPRLYLMGIYHGKLPADQIDFRRRMENRFGKPLEEIEARGEAREKAWKELEEAFGKLDTFLKKNQLELEDDKNSELLRSRGHAKVEAKATTAHTGADLGNSPETKDEEKVTNCDWVMGRRVSFSDFVLCGILIFLRSICEDEDWKRITSWNGGRWGKMYSACERWMTVDSTTQL